MVQTWSCHSPIEYTPWTCPKTKLSHTCKYQEGTEILWVQLRLVAQLRHGHRCQSYRGYWFPDIRATLSKVGQSHKVVVLQKNVIIEIMTHCKTLLHTVPWSYLYQCHTYVCCKVVLLSSFQVKKAEVDICSLSISAALMIKSRQWKQRL